MASMWSDPPVDLYKLSTEDHFAFLVGLTVGEAPYDLVHDRAVAGAKAN